MKHELKSVFFLIVFGALGCMENKIELEPEYKKYYPTEVGFYNVYQFDSVLYTEFRNTPEKYTFFLKEEVVEAFLNQEGEEIFLIRETIRKNETDLWEGYGEKYVFASNYEVIFQSGGVNLNVLQFPPKVENSWNSLQETDTSSVQSYIYKQVEVGDSVLGKYFENTLWVLEKDVSNLIDTVYEYSIYAFEIGLVEKYHKNISEQPGKPRTGFEIHKQFLYRNKNDQLE